MSRILVINPNSNDAVTEAISDGLDVFRVTGGPDIICETLAQGPFGIESQDDIDAVIDPLARIVSSRDDVDAFVIACYSDPGLGKCRSLTRKPVFGIHQSALLEATSGTSKFGVLALSENSIARHLKYHLKIGVADKLAKERSVDLTVDQGTTDNRAFDLLCTAGEKLRDIDGADIVILGCAGLAAHRLSLQTHLAIPVIDPTQAAVKNAIDVILGY